MSVTAAVLPDEFPFVLPADHASPEVFAKLTPEQRASAYRIRHRGDADHISLVELQFPAGLRVAPHAHETEEIVVVTQGEIHFGRTVYGVGSSVHIPSFTVYSFTAGPEGLTFLNFRVRRDEGILTPDEVHRRRAAEGQSVDTALAPAATPG